jgi:hypothetical protein|tara:strand:+ start:54 stop:293 length:240 start_codon:yes stop_codon:yes gene_type:complete
MDQVKKRGRRKYFLVGVGKRVLFWVCNSGFVDTKKKVRVQQQTTIEGGSKPVAPPLPLPHPVVKVPVGVGCISWKEKGR